MSPVRAMRIASAMASRRPGDFGRAGRAGHDGGADRCRIFAARIVVGDDHHVGHARRDRAHVWPFALVAVAAGAEHGDQAALDVRAKRRDRRFERVGRVRVIDIDRHAGAADHRALEPPAHRRNALHRREGRRPLAAGREHEPGGGQHVGGLVGADQRQREAVRLCRHARASRSGRAATAIARRGGSSRPCGRRSAAYARAAPHAQSLRRTWDRRSTPPPACPSAGAPRTAASWLRNRRPSSRDNRGGRG